MGKNTAPTRSHNILNDVRRFLLQKPALPSLIKYDTTAEREDYSQRIQQRLQIDVSLYSVLNIHQIGIDVPVRYVFDEIQRWDGDSTCWPNHIAEVERQRIGLDNISIFLFGQRQYPFGGRLRIPWLRYIPLFNLTVARMQEQADTTEADNARFVLFETTGGYPIGHFCMFVRSSISSLGETGRSQLFMMVGFDFYGKKSGWVNRLVQPVWEAIHNRVTANIMNRFKQFCEWRFEKIRSTEGAMSIDPSNPVRGSF